MQIANSLAGFSMAESDGLRKAMGKKLPAEMAKYKDRFVEGCATNNIDRKLAIDIYEMIERFAGYGFPKAHSAAYGVITAQTAYFKARFPVQFMAALMSTEIGLTDKTVFNVTECRRAGIPLLPPCINRSGAEFTVEEVDGKLGIRFGLCAVKNVGVGAVESIIERRGEASGRTFATLQDFCDAVDWSAVNKRAIESLLKAGALDQFGERAAVIASIDSLIAAAQQRQKASARGQMDLFGAFAADTIDAGSSALADVPPADNRQLLAWEKEFLGLYLTSHPLMDLTGHGAPDGYLQVAEVEGRGPGSKVRLLGMITTVRRITTKANRTMAVMEVEDLTGSMEVVAFPDAYEENSEHIREDAILDFAAKIDERGEKLQLILEGLTPDLPILSGPEPASPTVTIRLRTSDDLWQDIRMMQAIDEVLRQHEGHLPVQVELAIGDERHIFASRSRKVEWARDLQEELTRVMGVLGSSELVEPEATDEATDDSLLAVA